MTTAGWFGMLAPTLFPLADSAATAAGAPAGTIGLPLYLAIVLGLAVLSQWAAWLAKVPSLIVLLAAGFTLGQFARPDDIMGRNVLFAGVSITVGIILFEGALSLRFRELSGITRPVLRLFSVTVAIAWVLTATTAWLLGIDPRLAVLVGAILVVTGPTVIAPILRAMRPTRRVSSLLRWEGIVVDPIGAILAVLIFQVIVDGGEGQTGALIAIGVAKTLAVALGIAVPVGFFLGAVVRRHLVPDYLQGVVFLAAAVVSLVVSNLVAADAGLLTVTILGIVLANIEGLDLHGVREFKENLQVLFVGTLFIILAGRVSVADLAAVAAPAAILVVVLVLVIRPVSVLVGLLGTPATREERTLLAFMAPRGIIAAAVTSVFALDLRQNAENLIAAAGNAGSAQEADQLRARGEALVALGEDARLLVPLVFLVIVGTVTIYGLGVGRLAERLGLASLSPQGVLFAGTSPWIVATAAQLKELDVPVLIVGDRYRDLAGARMAGIRNEASNIVSEFAVEELELAGIRHFIAATSGDEVNSTAVREFRRILGRTNAWQVRRADDAHDDEGHKRKAPARHLIGRYPFAPALTNEELTERFSRGDIIKRTKLTDEYDIDDFREAHPDAVVMFSYAGGALEIVGERDEPLEPGRTVIAMVRNRDVNSRAEKNAAAKATKKAGAEKRAEKAAAAG